MSTLPADAVGASARFVLLRPAEGQALPLLVVDLEPPADHDDLPPALRDGLLRALLERGLVELPRFYGIDLPRGVRVGLTLEADRMRLEDDDETTLLRVPRAGVDADWVTRALELRGTMLCVGHGIGVGPDHDVRDVCDLVDLAATAGSVVGAIVGVAEPRTGLPLLFG